MERVFKRFFSDSALFNTREGRAGKVTGTPAAPPNLFKPTWTLVTRLPPRCQVHNFMLGLNLNTNMPFSPASGLGYNAPQLEEEVDAVTGKMDDRVCCLPAFPSSNSFFRGGLRQEQEQQAW